MKQQNYIVIHTERDLDAPKGFHTGRNVQVWRPGHSSDIVTSGPNMVVSLELVTTSVEEAQAKCVELGSPLSDEMLVAFAEAVSPAATKAVKVKLTRPQLETLSAIARRDGGYGWSSHDPVLRRLRNLGMVTYTIRGVEEECWAVATEAGKEYLRQCVGPLDEG